MHAIVIVSVIFCSVLVLCPERRAGRRIGNRHGRNFGPGGDGGGRPTHPSAPQSAAQPYGHGDKPVAVAVIAVIDVWAPELLRETIFRATAHSVGTLSVT